MMIRALSVYIYNNNNILTFWFLCQCVILLLLIMSVRRTRDRDVPENNNNDDDARRQRPRIVVAPPPIDPDAVTLHGLLINGNDQEPAVRFIEHLNTTRNVTEVTALFNEVIDPVDLLDTRDAWRVQLYLRQRSVTKVPLVHAVFATRTPSEESIQLLYETAEREQIILPWMAMDRSGFSPLHKACCATEVRALLRAQLGMFVNAVDAFGHTALAHAVNPDVAHALLAGGAGVGPPDERLGAQIRADLRATARRVYPDQTPDQVVTVFIASHFNYDDDATEMELPLTVLATLRAHRERWSHEEREAHSALCRSRAARLARRAPRVRRAAFDANVHTGQVHFRSI